TTQPPLSYRWFHIFPDDTFFLPILTRFPTRPPEILSRKETNTSYRTGFTGKADQQRFHRTSIPIQTISTLYRYKTKEPCDANQQSTSLFFVRSGAADASGGAPLSSGRPACPPAGRSRHRPRHGNGRPLHPQACRSTDWRQRHSRPGGRSGEESPVF